MAQGSAKNMLGLLFLGNTGETFSCKTSILRGGGQKLAADRLLRYRAQIFLHKGSSFLQYCPYRSFMFSIEEKRWREKSIWLFTLLIVMR